MSIFMNEPCSIQAFAPNTDCEGKPLPKPKRKISFNVPADKADSVKAYCDQLRRKFPHLKPNRIKKKAAQYFHLKQKI